MFLIKKYYFRQIIKKIGLELGNENYNGKSILKPEKSSQKISNAHHITIYNL